MSPSRTCRFAVRTASSYSSRGSAVSSRTRTPSGSGDAVSRSSVATRSASSIRSSYTAAGSSSTPITGVNTSSTLSSFSSKTTVRVVRANCASGNSVSGRSTPTSSNQRSYTASYARNPTKPPERICRSVSGNPRRLTAGKAARIRSTASPASGPRPPRRSPSSSTSPMNSAAGPSSATSVRSGWTETTASGS